MKIYNGYNRLPRNYTLLTDTYEINMAYGYFKTNKQNEIGVFDAFFRKVPNGGRYAIMAGLDKVIEYMKALCEEEDSKQDYIKIAKDNIDNIKSVAQNTILENGFNYDVNVSIGNFEFPTKTYGDVSFPAGFYDALRIEIGNASGKNWWCVMFPPLCFVDVTSGVVPEESKETLKSDISAEEFDLITGANSEVKFKFKLVEMFQNWGLVANR